MFGHGVGDTGAKRGGATALISRTDRNARRRPAHRGGPPAPRELTGLSAERRAAPEAGPSQNHTLRRVGSTPGPPTESPAPVRSSGPLNLQAGRLPPGSRSNQRSLLSKTSTNAPVPTLPAPAAVATPEAGRRVRDL